jgi:hypothetical protein
MSERAEMPPPDRSTTMPERLDAPCGLYCGGCDAYLATIRGTQEALAAACGRTPEEVTCRGCRSDRRAVYCKSCEIRDCIRRRGLDHCGLCPEFPCEKLIAFRDSVAHHALVLRNLRRRRVIGVEAWLREKQERWACPACSREAGWYDTQCCRCGAPLVSCREEDLSSTIE